MASALPTPAPPEIQDIVPLLLASLPASFLSSKPPPPLLPVLSPILRQRLDLNTSTGSAHDSWLRLLCWDSDKAEELKETIENSNFEPHPVSGELEVGEVDRISYKRFDAETLKVQIPLSDWHLTVLLLWCMGDQHEWKVSELLPYDSDLSQDPSWSSSPSAANELAQTRRSSVDARNRSTASKQQLREVQDDDDDYWAQYDQTPNNGTPGPRGSVNPGTNGTAASDADYYSRYADVQPAMDNYDPDEHAQESQIATEGSQSQTAIVGDETSEPHLPNEDAVHIDHPVPSPPSSRAGSNTIAHLESSADRYSASEIAIKQHISYTMKSMFRLAKGAGVSRQDFEDLIQRELETLSLLDRE